MKVATTRNVNARRSTKELPSCPKQVQNMPQLLPCAHQYDIRLRAKHFATKVAVFCNCCSCSILQVVQGDRHWRNVTERHYGSTHTRDNIPDKAAVYTMVPTRRVHFLVYTISDLNSLDVFLWSLVEDKVCVPSVHATFNNWNDQTRTTAKSSRAFVVKCMARSRKSS